MARLIETPTKRSEAMKALEHLHRTFGSAGLANPPIPVALQARLREIPSGGGWCWSTRAIDSGPMYGFGYYPTEAMTGVVDNYVAISHAGHGVNSYSINYHLVYGPLALFAQTGWGGGYMDAEVATAEVNEQLTRCRRLVEAAEIAGADVQAKLGRLVVLESTFRTIAACGWLARPLRSVNAAQEWIRSHAIDGDPLKHADQLLRREMDR